MTMVVLGWIAIVIAAVVLAATAGTALRGRSAPVQLAGSLLAAGLGAEAWFLLVHGFMMRADGVTTALGLSVALNIGLIALFIARGQRPADPVGVGRTNPAGSLGPVDGT